MRLVRERGRLADGDGEIVLFVENSVRTLTSGLKATTATGRSGARWAMNARAATIAPWIGLPVMLLDASMSRIAPFAAPGASTPSPRTAPPFSVTAMPPGLIVAFCGSWSV